MDKEQIKKLFNEFLATYDVEKHGAVWLHHSKTFREFWKDKILTYGKAPISEGDYDAIIRLLDVKGRGFNKATDEAVAAVGLKMGIWYRMFNDLKDNNDIRITLDKIFNSDKESVLIDLIARLEKENKDNKNGLTGKKASALNALLCINKPEIYLSSVSLSHRFQIVEAFGFGDPKAYKTYGEKVIKSNRDIIAGFKDKLGIDASPRTISVFLYASSLKSFWKKEVEGEKVDIAEVEEEQRLSASESDFAIEKHLEEFLVANWESTELGKLYDLIEEDDEVVTPQYPTDIGFIDLLVKEKGVGTYVVIELKKGQTSDATIGQLTRYMGWIKTHRAEGGKVKGIIIAGNYDERLAYALQMVPDTELFLYRINFSLERPKEK